MRTANPPIGQNRQRTQVALRKRPQATFRGIEALERRTLLSATISVLASLTTPPELVNDLTVDPAGNLYGTTQNGGTQGDGTAFEIVQGSGVLTSLATFDGLNGSTPLAAMAIDAAGNLFGTAATGGTSGDGTVFEIAKASGVVTTLASFSGTNGSTPDGGVIVDAGGNLFGTTVAGGANGDGTIFEVGNGTGTITTLASFTGASPPMPGSLVMDSHGNLFGGTSIGGPANAGTIFELASLSTSITTVASFTGANGSDPFHLLIDSSGNLFGVTEIGGLNNGGTVFEIAAGSSTITTRVNLNAGGRFPAELALDPTGDLVGLIEFGGAARSGTAYEIAAGSNTAVTVADFTQATGVDPIQLTGDGKGNFFGIAYPGGPNNTGTVFELSNVSIPTFGPALVNNSPLAPGISGRLPTTLVAGGKVSHVKQTVAITNTSGSAIRGNITVSVLLSPDPTGASGGISVASVTRKVNLKPGKKVSIPVSILSLPADAVGTLFLLPLITDSGGNTSFAVSAAPVSISAPTIDLAAQTVIVPRTAKAGKRATFKITIANLGNVLASGNLVIDLKASATGVIDANSSDLGTITRHVAIKPGKKLTLSVTETLPAISGRFFILADVDPGNTFNESVLTNNVVAGAQSILL